MRQNIYPTYKYIPTTKKEGVTEGMQHVYIYHVKLLLSTLFGVTDGSFVSDVFDLAGKYMLDELKGLTNQLTSSFRNNWRACE